MVVQIEEKGPKILQQAITNYLKKKDVPVYKMFHR